MDEVPITEAIDEAIDATWEKYGDLHGGSKEQWLAEFGERLNDPVFRAAMDKLYEVLSAQAEKLAALAPALDREEAFNVLVLGLLQPRIRVEDMPPLVTIRPEL